MIITQQRFKWTDTSTLSQWFIDGEANFYSNKYDKMLPVYALEDKDRDLHSYMTDAEVRKVKVHGETAIPYGKFRVIMSFSARFKKIMPEVIGVPGFSGIRIHNGSLVTHTEGCPLIGYKHHYMPDKDQFWVSQSRDCFAEIMSMLNIANEKEKMFLEIIK
ncbi:MAG: hypothetical protein DWQ44_09040 [Bacteroidetes bacterium]|nr:MAG: hypothetical protein DWQ33_02735 [Bacteroidota bacterium]REK06435.1 MAG: hypothetical protein DWQ39_02830 [Bacteroidota bacterium]REK33201.1 MAG: hypothetical protein DWQ44_09040 [Bacteroidota bacterium]REK47038.1 MAG: hypothetical protein DWQ48_13375 [Bacteroidota bacterium]